MHSTACNSAVTANSSSPSQYLVTFHCNGTEECQEVILLRSLDRGEGNKACSIARRLKAKQTKLATLHSRWRHPNLHLHAAICTTFVVMETIGEYQRGAE